MNDQKKFIYYTDSVVHWDQKFQKKNQKSLLPHNKIESWDLSIIIIKGIPRIVEHTVHFTISFLLSFKYVVYLIFVLSFVFYLVRLYQILPSSIAIIIFPALNIIVKSRSE